MTFFIDCLRLGGRTIWPFQFFVSIARCIVLNVFGLAIALVWLILLYRGILALLGHITTPFSEPWLPSRICFLGNAGGYMVLQLDEQGGERHSPKHFHLLFGLMLCVFLCVHVAPSFLRFFEGESSTLFLWRGIAYTANRPRMAAKNSVITP